MKVKKIRKYGSGIFNTAYIRKALAKSQPIVKPKSPGLLSQDNETMPPVHTVGLIHKLKKNYGQVVRTSYTLPICRI